MKYLGFTLLVIAFAAEILTANGSQPTKEETCATEAGVEQEKVKGFEKGEFYEDSKLKDYVFCLSKKIGFQNDAGDFRNDFLHLISSIGGQKGKAFLSKCAVKKDTPRETAYQFFKCFYNNKLQEQETSSSG
ncbi:PBP GOBP domain containing protein [Asbolus verrucosus]|uniref:PBP GOBP domain containing protein n=1 Tax=Asbolus verrucosus TaxID=1661398 RepID=A0A482VD30_ASBVE|nr:PBP GOBP domain containing protein [Asbolus verrucosus]